MSTMPLQFRPTPLDVPFDNRPNSALALAVKPWQFDSAGETAAKGEGILAARQMREGRAMDNALGKLKLDEAIGQAGALDAYRDRSAAGDPNALEALAGYPDLAAGMRKAIDEMDDADREAAHRQTLALAGAAAKASVYPEGSLGRTQAWQQQLDELHSSGEIDDDDYETMKAADPTDEMIDDIFRTSMSLDQAIAEWTKERASPTYDDLPLADKLKIDEEARKRAEAGLSEYDTVPGDEMEARVKAARDDILREYGYLPAADDEPAGVSVPKGGAPTPLAKSDRGVPSIAAAFTKEKPATPASQEDFDALPVGAFYVNPADGLTYQKTK